MKQKILLTLLLSTVVSVSAFTGCSKESTQESSTEITESQTETTESQTETTETTETETEVAETTIDEEREKAMQAHTSGLYNYKSGTVQNVFFERRTTSPCMEYGVIVGKDGNGELIWQYTTPLYNATQYDSISDVGQFGDKYLYAEKGVLVALNQSDGTIAWKNEDLRGTGVHAAFDANGVVYLTGSGPNLVVVEKDGTTRKVIEEFDANCYEPVQIEIKDGYVWVTLYRDITKEDESGAVFRVDINNFQYDRVK